MGDNGGHRGLSGDIKIVFAIPTDDPGKWRMKNGRLTYSNGFVAGLDVEGGYIPQIKGTFGLTASYCLFTDIRKEGDRLTGDIRMETSVNGRMMESSDIASGVEVIPFPESVTAPDGTGQTLLEQV